MITNYDDDTLLILQMLALESEVVFISSKLALELYDSVKRKNGFAGDLKDANALKLALHAPMVYQLNNQKSDIKSLAKVLREAIISNEPFSSCNFELAGMAESKFIELNTSQPIKN